jgi:hypothetical protein
MADPLFDHRLLSLRRTRARRQGEQLFVAERAVEDLAERLALVRRPFGQGMVIGCPEPLQPRLASAAGQVAFEADLNGLAAAEPGTLDLLLVLGQLDTANDLQPTLHILRFLLAPGGLLAGVFPGHNSLPALRTALVEADRAVGTGFTARIHPRIEASAFAGLLQESGFVEPVVDLDRLRLRYRRLEDLVADLRGMAATNVLTGAKRPLSRAAWQAARAAFAAAGDDGRTEETIELVHFAAWAPDARQSSLTPS